MRLPRLYPIIGVDCFRSRPDPTSAILEFARELIAAGCTVLQYRNKSGSSREMLSHGRELRRIAGSVAKLIMNDRADLALAANFDGVHVGQDDLPVDAVRRILGADKIVGTSTHNPDQLRIAAATEVDYVAIGPVFTTSSKTKPDPTVGLEGVRAARALTSKPLVAIGGITRANCRDVITAGADSVAVIADLLDNPQESAEAFFRLLV